MASICLRTASVVLALLALTCVSAMAEVLVETGDFGDTPATGPLLPMVGGAMRITGEIGAAGDVDFFRFQANEGDWIVLDTDWLRDSTGATNPIDTALALFDPSNTLLAYNDDSDGYGSEKGLGSVIAPFQAGVTGTFSVAVSSYENEPLAYANSSTDNWLPWSGDITVVDPQDIGNAAFTGGGTDTDSYDMLVGRFQPTAVIETTDFSDVRASAHHLTAPEPGKAFEITGQIETDNDIDWFKISLLEGQALYLDTETLTPELDTMLSLFDADGVMLAHSDDCDGNCVSEYGYGSTIATFIVPADGDYYVAVTSYDNYPNAWNYSTDTELLISGYATSGVTADDMFVMDGEESGDYVALFLVTTDIPEPTTLSLLVLGVPALIRRRRKLI